MIGQLKDIFIKADIFNYILNKEGIGLNLNEIKSPCKFVLDESVKQERTVINFYTNKYKKDLIRLIEDLIYATRTPVSNTASKLPNGTSYSLYRDIILHQLESGVPSTVAINNSKEILLQELKPATLNDTDVRRVVFLSDYATKEDYIKDVNKIISENSDCIEVVEVYTKLGEFEPMRMGTDNLRCCHEIMGYLCPYDSRFLAQEIIEFFDLVKGFKSTDPAKINSKIGDIVELFGSPINIGEWVFTTITFSNLLAELDDYIKVVGGK